MKIIYQIGILFSLCWVSQIVEWILPIPFPASVIGMVLLFILLCTKVLRVDHIREKTDFLLGNMAFFFLPAGVSILNYVDVLKSTAVQLVLICVITTVITFGVTALSIRMTMALLERGKTNG